MYSLLTGRLKRCMKWCLPYGLINEVQDYKKNLRDKQFLKKHLGKDGIGVLLKNEIFKNKHKDDRCFLVGTGPSINQQDMFDLKNEKCIFLSEFYLHNKFSLLDPCYYLHSGFYIHKNISTDLALKSYEEMEQKIPENCILFLNYLDRDFINKNRLFKNHIVHYLLFKKDINYLFHYGIDMCGLLYGAAAINVMVLQVALYMGFKEIYLLGWDGWRRNKRVIREHFYDEDESIIGNCPYPAKDTYSYWEIECRHALCFLNELKQLHKFAQQCGVKIYNATKNSAIDFFPKIKFESLFDK